MYKSQILRKIEPQKRLPVELFLHAIEHLRGKTEIENRITFILLDNSIELALKVYLASNKGGTLEEEITFSNLIAKFNIYVNPNDTAKKLIKRLSEFHGIRNKLYHTPELTPTRNEVEEFSEKAKMFLEQFLKIDGLGEKDRLMAAGASFFHHAEQMGGKLAAQDVEIEIESLREEIELAIERLRPELVLPSFRKRMKRLKDMPEYQDASQTEPNEERVIELWKILEEADGGILIKSYSELLKELSINSVEFDKLFPLGEEVLSFSEVFDKFYRGEIDQETYQEASDLHFEVEEKVRAKCRFWNFVVSDPNYLYMRVLENEAEIDIRAEDYKSFCDFIEHAQKSEVSALSEVSSQSEMIAIEVRKMRARLYDLRKDTES